MEPRPDPARSPVTIDRFRVGDQEAARALVLSGLAEHWGEVDPSLNPDLDDIGLSYASDVFLVARAGGRVVATGALVRRTPGEAEVVRMSVTAGLRRQGLGGLVLGALVLEARRLGIDRLVLETTSTWTDVIAFYLAHGFAVTHAHEAALGTDVWFACDLR